MIRLGQSNHVEKESANPALETPALPLAQMMANSHHLGPGGGGGKGAGATHTVTHVSQGVWFSETQDPHMSVVAARTAVP